MGLIRFPVLYTGSRRPEAVLNKYPVAEPLPSFTPSTDGMLTTSPATLH